MKICGIKLTHDGSVALIDNNRLVFSIEMEKIGNNPRYSEMRDMDMIFRLLREHNYDPAEIDEFVIDGWQGKDYNVISEQGEQVEAIEGGKRKSITVAPYREQTLKQDLIREYNFETTVANRKFSYSSYTHIGGHVMGAYCSSPFAQRNENSFVLVWDGGVYPRLYFFDTEKKQVRNFGHLFLLFGGFYGLFAKHFGPFKPKGDGRKELNNESSIAGKVMAYIALGKPNAELISIYENIYRKHLKIYWEFVFEFVAELKKQIAGRNFSDEDILASMHVFLENLLMKSLEEKIGELGMNCRNLCYAGGCALNIKWNSRIRDSGLFDEIWIPPFTNDSGSAIGTACCKMLKETGNFALHWDTYSGPAIITNENSKGWDKRPCTIAELASLLHESNEPVVYLQGKAELGPRALGNRSIIASPIHPGMKDKLNEAKVRETYRPIAPICIEERAPLLFEPGIPDPFMLFEHRVRPEWLEKIPAVCHIDGTARLQTINSRQHPKLYELLLEFEKLSGCPVLTNTSANHNGRGFFPDVKSVLDWGRLNYVWCDGQLYVKKNKFIFGNPNSKTGLLKRIFSFNR